MVKRWSNLIQLSGKQYLRGEWAAYDDIECSGTERGCQCQREKTLIGIPSEMFAPNVLAPPNIFCAQAMTLCRDMSDICI